MEPLKDADRWFSTPVNDTWCRLGGNGPINVSQLMPLVKYVDDFDTFLDVGCGSGTTIDALKAIKKKIKYKGVDFIESRVAWLKDKFLPYTFGIGALPDTTFEVQDARHLKEEDQSWDIVWSRHVIDHLDGFEQPMDEQCRVAKKYAICVLWYSLHDGDEHIIKNVIEGPMDNRKTYVDEYLNQYSRKKVKAYLDNKCKEGWGLIEFREHISWEGDKLGKGDDTIIVLKRI
jgi:ubiquinone/menaquinone biosynthesis C-methylase UbiE